MLDTVAERARHPERAIASAVASRGALLFSLLVAGSFLAAGCHQGVTPEAAANAAEATPAAAPAPVTVAPPASETVPPGPAQAGSDAPPAGPPVLTPTDPALVPSTCPLPAPPAYPEKARHERIEGKVIARCVVEPDGTLSGCTLLKSHPSFDAEVLAALARSRVRPFTANGQPVRVACYYPFSFKLE